MVVYSAYQSYRVRGRQYHLERLMIKRWFIALFIAGCLMVADVLALVGVTRAFLPKKPPMWATAPFFWVLAWPVQIFTWMMPQSGNQRGGPPLAAIALGALIDLVLLALIVDWIRRRRSVPR